MPSFARCLRRACWIGVVLLAAGCARGAFSVPADARSIADLAPAAAQAAVLGAGDAVQVLFFGHEELSGEYLVNERGEIQYPLAGNVRVAGLTGGEAEAALRHALREYFETPPITVTPLIRVNVFGAVVAPGIYGLQPSMSLLDAIGRAGGPAREADVDRMVLVRDGTYYRLDLRDALRAARNLAQLGVRTGDVIIVPERPRTTETLTRVTALVSVLLAATNTIILIATR